MAKEFVCTSCGYFGPMRNTIFRKGVCSKCSKRTLIPYDTPIGQEILAKHNIDIEKERTTRHKTLNFSPAVFWFFGIILIMSGLPLMVSNTGFSILLILLGVVLLPPFDAFLKRKYNINFGSGKKLIVFVIVMFVGLIYMGANSPDSNNASQNSTNQTISSVSSPRIGEAGHLRLPNDGKLICLGHSKDDYDKIQTALMAGDYIGLTQIPGAFCVGVGTKVLVIDKSWTITEVRITQTYKDVDNDKFGMSGWVASEFVVK